MRRDDRQESFFRRIFFDGNGRGNRWAWGIVDSETGRSSAGVVFGETSQRTELLGLLEAIRSCPKSESFRTTICGDSQYAISGASKWLRSWKANEWRGSNGTVANVDLWKLIADEIDARPGIAFEKVSRSQNSAADRASRDALRSRRSAKRRAREQTKLDVASLEGRMVSPNFADRPSIVFRGGRAFFTARRSGPPADVDQMAGDALRGAADRFGSVSRLCGDEEITAPIAAVLGGRTLLAVLGLECRLEKERGPSDGWKPRRYRRLNLDD